MLHAVEHVAGGVLWANLHLLFWLSLVAFVTGWMSENHFATVPVALYGVALLMSGIASYILARILVAQHGRDSMLARALGQDFKASHRSSSTRPRLRWPLSIPGRRALSTWWLRSCGSFPTRGSSIS